jgi:GDPmannose 4,6-dehydratase
MPKNIMKKAFITGINGQDGSYLAELLLSKNYKVYGIVRRNSFLENQTTRLDNIYNKLELNYGDILDETALENIINKVKPDEIYNLAGQSHVRISFEIPKFTAQTNGIGVLNILEAIRKNSRNSKFYQASSSEMFGISVDPDGYQRETTKFDPNSSYGCAKVFGYNLVRYYRRAYNIFACNGILFNHESPRRGSNFVTNKIIKAAVRIKLNLEKKLYLGNLDAFRDWGHSKDYVDAMYKVVNYAKADDFVIATGETYSVRQLCDVTFKKLGLNYKNYVIQKKEYYRPSEVKYLRGDSKKARKLLKWKPKYTFSDLIEEMTNYWLDYYNKNNPLKFK